MIMESGKTNRRDSADGLSGHITALEALDRAGCCTRWRAAFGNAPPKHLSVAFMRDVLIWQLQCEKLGGLPPDVDRTLRRIATGRQAAGAASPGTLLIREWNGRTYQVEVTETGYVMDGRTWRSLSAIARHITGAHWSGPRFFGLNAKVGT